jgi:hypothetical protein
MQHFVNIVEQLNEAVRFISDGSTAHARMALLLLDNAAELLLSRPARCELARDDMNARLYERTHEIRRDGFVDDLPDLPRLLSRKERREVEFTFDAKADLLVERKRLDAGTADVLKGLHRHRNDTYHKERLRIPIVRATAILYLNLCCDLLETFGREGSWAMGEEWSGFLSKYGLAQGFFFDDRAMATTTARFRNAVGIDDRELAGMLADYLCLRLDAIEDELDHLDYYKDRDEALRIIQFTVAHGDEWNKKLKERGPALFRKFEAAKAKYAAAVTNETLIEWRGVAERLTKSAGLKAELFAEYHRLELAMEPIEMAVGEEAAGYDHHIQLEIDARRGK